MNVDKNRITKIQHYVPRIYLRGFSTNKKQIWSYTIDPLDNGTYVSIRSVCQEDYLYEVRDDAGNILTPNWIERIFTDLEGMFATKLRELENKAFLKENYRTRCFLTIEEKAFWKAFVAIQMMRSPIVLREANAVIKELSQGLLTDNQVRAMAVSQCLPFFNELKLEDKNVFNFFLRPLLNMATEIGVDEAGTLFTSDNPIYCYSLHRENISQIEEYDTVILPLTPNLVLSMYGSETAKIRGRNRLVPLDHEAQEKIKLSIAYSAAVRIFSKTELAPADIDLIEKARKDKATDKAENRG